jgi:hypothetical protein
MFPKLLESLGGGDPDVLDQCPRGERSRIRALGGVVLMMAILAFLAMSLTLHDQLDVPTPVALPLAAAFGVGMANFDRWLLTSARRQRTWWLTVLLAIPRIAVAIAIGLVIAETLLLRSFGPEVTAQAQTDRQEQLAAGLKDLDTTYARIPQLEARQSALETTAAGGADTVYAGNPDYRDAKSAVTKAQDALAQAKIRAGCEEGGTCGTQKRGCGPVCRAKREIVAQRRTELEGAAAALDAVRVRLDHDATYSAKTRRTQANSDLTQVKVELGRVRADRDRDKARLQKAYNLPIGLADRKEALSRLSAEHASINATAWMLRLFLWVLDIAPVFFKTLLLLGRRSVYEEVQETMEARARLRLDTTEDARDRAHSVDMALIVREAEIRSEHAIQSLEEVHAEIAEVQKVVWREYVEEWRQAVRRQMAQWKRASTGRFDRDGPMLTKQNGSGPPSQG